MAGCVEVRLMLTHAKWMLSLELTHEAGDSKQAVSAADTYSGRQRSGFTKHHGHG